LWISTSAKSSAPYEPKFTFLDGNKWQEYGAIYRYREPGQLTVQTEWKDGATRFEFNFTTDRVTIKQDGKELGSIALEPDVAARILGRATVQSGRGVYGPFGGKMLGWGSGTISR
jgi:hypothetical protein